MLWARGVLAVMLLGSVAGNAQIVGPEACQPCHPAQYASQRASHHAKALSRIRGTTIAAALTDRAVMRDRSGTALHYRAVDGGVEVRATRDGESAVMLLEWAFGAGSQAYTAVGRMRGEYVEHRVSWYANGRLGLTAGHPANAGAGVEAVLGVPQAMETVSRC